MKVTPPQVQAVAAALPVTQQGFVQMPPAVGNRFVRRLFARPFRAEQPALKRLVW